MPMYVDRIRESYEGLTKSQQKLANFVVDNYRDVAFMTCAELGHTLDVDQATVVRFAQALGYSGYTEMLDEIQEIVKAELKTVHDIPEMVSTSDQAFYKALLLEKASLDQLLVAIKADTIHEVLDLVLAAKRIYLVGQGTSAYAADIFGWLLRLAGLPAYTVERDMLSRFVTFANVSEGDLVVGVCFGREPVETANAVRFASEHGAKTLGIVSSGTCLVAQAAQKIVVIPNEGVYGPSLVPTITVMQGLFTALVQKKGITLPDVEAELAKVFAA
jgi:DNA-binding MurR/RpiR family transcriptional regulator